MTTYSNAFFGIPDDDRRFNLVAAVDAYEWVIGHPGEARFVLSKALYDNVPRDMEYHKPVIDKVVDTFISKQLADAKRGVARAIISKSERGENTEVIGSAVMVIDAISKAYSNDTPEERRQRTERQTRDRFGRFVVMARKIQPRQLPQMMEGDVAYTSHNIPNPRMNDNARYKWQNDYMQVRDALNAAVREGGGTDAAQNMLVNAKYSDGSNLELTLPEAKDAMDDPDTSNTGLMTSADYSRGIRLTQIEALNNRPQGAGPGFDALSGMTNPRFASAAAGAYTGALEAADEWTAGGSSDYRTNDQFWRRMGSASQLAATVGAPYLPPAATMALQAGKWVGDLAPEAEKVIGPTARKTAYRYRGTEKKPDENYQRIINQARTEAINSNDPLPGRKAHKLLIQGDKDPKTKDDIPSPLIDMFKGKLTNAARYHLNRQAGTIPPSQGIIIDRKGRVATEAVGYGEDWYLPFNYKNISRLDGGEYIRTRAYGGPTTEDIYTGLVSGARGLTVVSHSGVFHIEFDDTFRGTRRYNDKAGRMQDRYGQLLDAVKSKKVRLGDIRPERMEELKLLAADRSKGGFDPIKNRADYNDRLNTLKKEEQENPELSNAEKDSVARGLLNDWAKEHGSANWDDFTVTQANRGDLKPLSFKDDLEEAIDYAGLGKPYEKELESANAIMREELSPLDLNGKGYHQAMEALRDQFPYYISDVYFSGAGVQAKDLGYVKPRFIRPEGALAGYYDPSITGKGKITADQTNYQNYSVMRNQPPPKDIKAGDEEEPVSGSAVRGARGATNVDANKLDLLMEQIKALRGENYFSEEYENQGDEEIAGQVIDEEATSFLATNPSYKWTFLSDDEDDIERKIYDGGVNGQAYKKYKAQVAHAFETKMFGVTPDDIKVETGDITIGTDAAPKTAMSTLLAYGDIADGKVYNWPDLKIGQDRDYYNSKISVFKEKAPAMARVDMEDREEVKDAMEFRGEQLKKALKAVHQGRDVGITEDQITEEAFAMAKILQAIDLRADAPDSAPSRGSTPTTLRRKREPAPFAEASETEADKKAAALMRRLDAQTDDEDEILDVEQEPMDPDEMARKQRIAKKQGEINAMVGLKTVSAEIDGLIHDAEYDSWRRSAGYSVDEDRTHHLVFTGNPGTGKTTVARKLASIYKDLGITTSNELAELKEGDLVGEWSNQENTHVNEVLNANKGKVIFIDEAYTMLDSEGGKKALNVILQWAEDNRDDSVIVLAGYPKQMADLMRYNPGFNSRFPTKVHFPDYDAKDLREIAKQRLDAQQMKVAPDAQASLNIAVGKLTKMPPDEFANARSARNLVQKINRAHAIRMGSEPNATVDERLTITKEDIKSGVLLHNEGQLMENAVKARRRVAAGIA